MKGGQMIRVTAAIIEKNGQILIAKRLEGGPAGGKWEFPGGKIEPNETPEECLKRELFEEFTIDATIGRFICSIEHHYSSLSVNLLVYRVNQFKGSIQPISHQEIEWINVKDLSRIDLAGADKKITKFIMEGENGF
jgi:8-oxo-dGTP diphosphatase